MTDSSTQTQPVYLGPVSLERAYRTANPGGHWFDADTMRFFKSRIASEVYRVAGIGWYFVSSERGWWGPRRYTARFMDEATGDIEEFGEFQEYASLSGALNRIRREAKAGNIPQKILDRRGRD